MFGPPAEDLHDIVLNQGTLSTAKDVWKWIHDRRIL